MNNVFTRENNINNVEASHAVNARENILNNTNTDTNVNNGTASASARGNENNENASMDWI